MKKYRKKVNITYFSKLKKYILMRLMLIVLYI